MVVFTQAGLMLHDDELGRRERALRLDLSAHGVLKDIPFSFALAADGSVGAVAFSNTTERDVVVYDMSTLDELGVLDMETERGAPVQGLALDPTGARVFVRGDFWGMYDVATGERLWGAEGPGADCCGPQEMTFSRDGEVVFGFNQGQLEARQAQTGELIFSVESGSTPGTQPSLARSGMDGVLVGTRSTISRGAAGRVEGFEQAYVFWSERDGSVVREFPQFEERAMAFTLPSGSAIACSPSGDSCASSVVVTDAMEGEAPEYSVALWSTDGELLHELPTFANGLSFSPDGEHLAIAGGPAELYRVEDGTLVAAMNYSYSDF